MLTPAEYTFWWRVEARDDCLEWQGYINPKGYGITTNPLTRKPEGAHRMALRYAGVPVFRGDCVLHSCDNPPCCNPNHLRVGTHKDNSDDKVKRGRHGRAKLTLREVQEIRSITGWGYKSTARLYGVGSRAIQKIRKGERWVE